MEKEIQIKGEHLKMVLLQIADGNKKALKVLIDLLDHIETNKFLKLLELNITGKQFLKLWINCANKDIIKMIATIDLLNRNALSAYAVEINMSEKNPIPFVDEEVEVDGMKYWDYRLIKRLDEEPKLNNDYCQWQEARFWEKMVKVEAEKDRKELKKLTSFWRVRI